MRITDGEHGCVGGGTDGDVGSGVAMTSVLVAAARAIETHHPKSLVRDPLAEHFVRAAPTATPFPTRIEQVGAGDGDPLWGRIGRYVALRTRTFDDRIQDAVTGASSQVVLLGAGLDTRAFRLDWPDGCTWYEIDRPEVHAFKGGVLDSLCARPQVERRVVRADVETDWRSPLLAAGFEPARPTVWVVEGLVLYLSATAEETLFDTIDDLSPAGSRLVFELVRPQDSADVRDDRLIASAEESTGADLRGIISVDGRPDSIGRLTGRGWAVTDSPVSDFTRRYGRGPEPDVHDALGYLRWAVGTKR